MIFLAVFATQLCLPILFLKEATLYKYRLLVRQLETFAEAHNLQRQRWMQLLIPARAIFFWTGKSTVRSAKEK
jgi:hypothetical protein